MYLQFFCEYFYFHPNLSLGIPLLFLLENLLEELTKSAIVLFQNCSYFVIVRQEFGFAVPIFSHFVLL